MEKGDISNEVSPRLVVVFEGLIASLPEGAKARAQYDSLVKKEKWSEALALFEINELMAKHVLDLVWRQRFTVDVVTFIGPEMAELIEKRMDDEGIPIGRVFHTSSVLLGRSVAYRPDIAVIYDPDPSHRFTYGSKGRIMSPSAPNFFFGE